MTKWEYLVLTCDNIPSVFWINGDRPKKIEHDTVTLFGGGGRELQEPYLYEYLREAGKWAGKYADCHRSMDPMVHHNRFSLF